MFSVLPNYALDEGRGMGAFSYEGARPKMPLVLVSHFPYRRLLFGNKRIIFMVRDPRDVMVSAYFHATKHKHRFAGDMTQFIEDPKQGIADLIRYLNGWAKGLQRHRHFILSYERLQADAPLQTEKALRFLGCEVDRIALDEAIRASQFKAMREMEKAEGIPDHDYDRGDEESLRMRRGKAGGFTEYLTPENASLVERTLSFKLSPEAKDLVRETGLDLAGR
jgi:Sulfotransferase domain